MDKIRKRAFLEELAGEDEGKHHPASGSSTYKGPGVEDLLGHKSGRSASLGRCLTRCLASSCQPWGHEELATASAPPHVDVATATWSQHFTHLLNNPAYKRETEAQRRKGLDQSGTGIL